MLTGDQSLIDISWSVQYRIADPLQYLFQLRDPQVTPAPEQRDGDARAGGAATALPSLLRAMRARALARRRAGAYSKLLDGYGAGINVVGVNLIDVQLPDPVLAARARRRARPPTTASARSPMPQAYASDIVPKAQSAAQQQLSDAQVYATQTRGHRARAMPSASRCRRRRYAQGTRGDARAHLHRDHGGAFCRSAHKIFIDAKTGNGNVIYLPLDKLAEAIRAAAPAAAAGNQPNVPAAPGVGAAAAPAGATEAPDDAHNRERPER